MGTAEQVTHDGLRHPFIEIMDSTLRDGEQTSGVSFLPHEKMMIAKKLLSDVNVDRIEVGQKTSENCDSEQTAKLVGHFLDRRRHAGAMHRHIAHNSR